VSIAVVRGAKTSNKLLYFTVCTVYVWEWFSLLISVSGGVRDGDGSVNWMDPEELTVKEPALSSRRVGALHH